MSAEHVPVRGLNGGQVGAEHLALAAWVGAVGHEDARPKVKVIGM